MKLKKQRFFPEATVKKYDLWTIIQIKNMLS